MISPIEIKVKLKEAALKLKFDDLRVCGTEDFSESDASSLRRWLEDGMNDRMVYLEKAFNAKVSPRSYFPEAKSAICVCANYWRESAERRIALYAQSKDYHGVIKPKLLELAAVLEPFGGKQRISVDSSPLWEKLLAARSGLGWIGKNTLLTRESNGPWSFIGIILTNLELPRDSALENRCGKCSACIDACPSKALGRSGIDARKCVSNLTIERRGGLSEGEKELVGKSIFGCDLCLRACPFGKNAPAAAMEEFRTSIVLSVRPTGEEVAAAAKETPMSRKFSSKNTA